MQRQNKRGRRQHSGQPSQDASMHGDMLTIQAEGINVQFGPRQSAPEGGNIRTKFDGLKTVKHLGEERVFAANQHLGQRPLSVGFMNEPTRGAMGRHTRTSVQSNVLQQVEDQQSYKKFMRAKAATTMKGSIPVNTKTLPNIARKRQRNQLSTQMGLTQKLMSDNAMSRVPSQTHMQNHLEEFFMNTKSEKLRIAVPQSKNAAISYWKKKDSQNTKSKYMETQTQAWLKDNYDPSQADKSSINRKMSHTKTATGFQKTKSNNFFASLGERDTNKNKILLNQCYVQALVPSSEEPVNEQPAKNEEGLQVFTNMNVDQHDFEVKSRRIQKDQITSLSQQRLTITGVPSDHRLATLPSTSQLSERGQKKPPFSRRPITKQGSERPMSGTSSTFLQGQQGSMAHQQLKSLAFLEKSKDHAGSRDTLMEDDALSQVDSQGVGSDKISMDRHNNHFSKQLMTVRPTTALIGTADSHDKLPYPELFDRSERTFAATFAKYGDLSYFTPVQRIGSYMDYSQRLTKRHLMDLIAYQKTSKVVIKADDDANKNANDYLDHCLFHGNMLNEVQDNSIVNSLVDHTIPEVNANNCRFKLVVKMFYNPCSSRKQILLEAEKVWAPPLLKQMDLSIVRMLKYVDSLECIKDEELSQFKSDWIVQALVQTPIYLQKMFKPQLQQLFKEVQLSYKRSMKQAIMDYILRSPDERKRLHILMLPAVVSSAHERQVRSGGYSIGIYQGTHTRKTLAENEIKFRLIINNIVVSSLQNWTQEFRNLLLVNLHDFSMLVNARNIEISKVSLSGGEFFVQQPGNTIDFDNFLSFQEAVLEKTKAVMKHIWHRGAILIAKKYKFLKTRETQKQAYPGHAAQSRWTYSGLATTPAGYGCNINSIMYEKLAMQTETIKDFQYNGGSKVGEKFTPYQEYAFRTACVHKNVDELIDFTKSETENVAGVLKDLAGQTDLNDLVDIRQSPAYIQFIQIVESFIDWDKNGYEDLAKEYKRELKYAAGNLMTIHLREMVTHSVTVFANFFEGFKTYEQLRQQMPDLKPLRKIKPMQTKFTSERERQIQEQKEAERKFQQRLQSKQMNAHLVAQLEQRKKTQQNTSNIESNKNEKEEGPTLRLPDFMDYQDFVNPIFHLELILGTMQDPQSFSGPGDLRMLRMTQRVQFNKSDEQITEHMDAFYGDLVTSFNDFSRPEFCKVRLFNRREMEGQQDTDHARKLQLEQMRKQRRREHNHLPTEQQAIKDAKSRQIYHYSLAPLISPPTLDFDKLLYTTAFDNPFAYEKYMGRIKVEEKIHLNEKRIVPVDAEEGEVLFANDFVNRALNVAQVNEDFFQTKRKLILRTLKSHLQETKRVHELYEQFQQIIQGQMQERVNQFVQKFDNILKETAEYTTFLNELRNYKSLALQLPDKVSFPMFEVGLRIVNRELLSRIDSFMFTVLTSFEEALADHTHALCIQFQNIYDKLKKDTHTAEEVVATESYKARLLVDMTTIQKKLDFNKRSVFFLLTQNCHQQIFLDPREENGRVVEGECNKLVQDLMIWPTKLNQYLDERDEQHQDQRMLIEKQVFSKKYELEKSIKEFQEVIKKVQSNQFLKSFGSQGIDYIKTAKNNLNQMEELKQQILSEEKLLFGTKSEFNGLKFLQNTFDPYYELWTNIEQLRNKKSEIYEAGLLEIDAEQLDDIIKRATQSEQRLIKKFGQSGQSTKNILNSLSGELRKLRDDFKPVVDVLCNQALKDRHWQQIKLITGSNNADFKNMRFSEVLMLQVHDRNSLRLLNENMNRAKKQDRLENILTGMQKEWKDVNFELKMFKDSDIPILIGANVEVLQSMLDEHVLQAQMVKNNPDVEPLIVAASDWEHTMLYTQEILEIWLRVQTNYLFLVPIFSAGGIQEEVKNLLDHESFKLIDVSWREIMSSLKTKNRVLDLEAEFPNLLEELKYQDDRLQTIQSSLNAYLESKREFFPRFYFLPNEDLIEILGDSQKPKLIQKHLKKCFEGINKVSFRDAQIAKGLLMEEVKREQIYEIVSQEGEKVPLSAPILPHLSDGQVEKWLSELEHQMRVSIKQIITEATQDYPTSHDQFQQPMFDLQSDTAGLKQNQEFAKWLSRWQSQVLIVVQQILWTRNVETALDHENSRQQLIRLYHSRQNQLLYIVSMVRDKLPNLLRLTLSSLIVVEVHARDVVENLARTQTDSKNDFNWINNMRYYQEVKTQSVKVSMVMTDQVYNNEFLGNTGRLVITPLTDRCYRTLMSALALNLGGAPEGPAGTGKTETTKDLAKAVAIHCLVFNCGEGLNAKFMSKMFKGLATGGSWSCFDEFNRIELEVLSVIAQQILEIQRAKAQQLTEFTFEDSLIRLLPTCNVFITMNPGYAGRSNLPDNLKALFRPVAMMIPEYSMISEISLYSFGFLNSRTLAKKIVQTYRLCSEQLSTQYHYDYGMRAVKAVLTTAKNLKYSSAKKQVYEGSSMNTTSELEIQDRSCGTPSEPNQVAEESEESIVLRSLQDVNLPKFLAEDIPLFQGIINDLFQGLEIPSTNYPQLRKMVYKAYQELNFQKSGQFTQKVFQLYDMVKVRHGLMVVGPAHSGKSAVITSLKKALNLVAIKDPSFEELETETHVINPKSVTIKQLYGSYDPVSQEFQDGIIGSVFRKCAYKNSKGHREWIIFDGPVDADWIENMNTVLDDNKRLCLVNGEVIQMTPLMNMIFETHDLSYASPATVSRCGMVFCAAETYKGWQTLLESWLVTFVQQTQLATVNGLNATVIVERLRNLFKLMYHPLLTNVLSQCKLIIPMSETQVTASMLKIMGILTSHVSFTKRVHDDHIKQEEITQRIDMIFQYAIIWSLGAVTDEAGQKKFQYSFERKVKETFKVGGQQFRIERHSLIHDQNQPVHNFKIDDMVWVSWKDLANKSENNPEIYDETPFNEIIITTTENLKQIHMLNLLLRENLPTLLIGGTGTGKTIAVNRFLRALETNKYDSTTICFSAKSSANTTQETIVSKLEKRNRKLLGPASNKKFVVFVDDLNMPTVEKNGAQPPIELLRQWLDHEAWYDYKERNNTLKVIKGISLLGAMCPHDGGKNLVSPRFARHFNIISCIDFDDTVLERIYGKIIDCHISRERIRGTNSAGVLKGIVEATIDIYNFAQAELKPTPAKSHYLFNLRDISRVLQGIHMMRKFSHAKVDKLVRLWVHEIARVFTDRLNCKDDQQKVFKQLATSCRVFIKEDFTLSLKKCLTKEQAEQLVSVENTVELMTEQIRFTDLLDPGKRLEQREYEEVQSEKQADLVAKLYLSLRGGYNVVATKPMDLVLFDFAVTHILRITRVLKISKGNILLIGLGGSGRRSLSTLAAFLMEQELFTSKQTKNYKQEDWALEVKDVMMKTGLANKNCTLLLNDQVLKFDYVLADINNLINQYEIPGIFSKDDKVTICETCRLNARNEMKMELYHTTNQHHLMDYFTKKVEKHLHVILCMSPTGTTLQERIRMFPSLINCCTINWFTDWPQEALVEVANKFLEEIPGTGSNQQHIQEVISKFHSDSQKLSESFFNQMKRRTYVTPTTYLDLMNIFQKLLYKQRQSLEGKKRNYETGIQKLVETQEQVEQMKINLQDKQPQLEIAQVQASELEREIAKESTEVVEPQKRLIQQEEQAAHKIAVETETIKIDCEAELARALPILKQAQDALNTIKPKDLIEIKSLQKPPELIRLTLHAVCVMLDRKCEKTPKKDNPKVLEDNWWLTAQRLMSENFLDQLLNFDKDNIEERIINKIRALFLADPQFRPAVIAKASQAAKGLCKWVMKLEEYHSVVVLIHPKKLALADAKIRYKEAYEQLTLKQGELKKIVFSFELLQQRLHQVKMDRKQLFEDIKDCEVRLQRAQILIDGLGGEGTRWEQSLQEVIHDLGTIVPDVLLSSVIIAYLGPFTQQFRNQVQTKWVKLMKSYALNLSTDFSLEKVLGEQVVIKQWQKTGLPYDSFSIENGIIMSNAIKWPLLIDPQGQANRWIKNMETKLMQETNYATRLIVVKPQDPNFARHFEQALRMGLVVLLENVGEQLDPLLDIVLLQQVFTSGGVKKIKFGDEEIDYADEFKLYMTTKIANPHYEPELTTKVTTINFMITHEILCDQLLNLVVKKENNNLESERLRLIEQQYLTNKQLAEVELTILSVLRESEGNILDDEKAIDILRQSQQLSEQIKKKQVDAAKTEIVVNKARKIFYPIARHSSMLFFVLQKLSQVDVMYQYSLSWFIQLFENVVDFSVNSNHNQTIGSDSQMEMSPEAEAEHVAELIDGFTYSIYSNVCRSIFEKDKLLFSFLLTASIRLLQGRIPAVQYQLLTQEIDSRKNPSNTENPSPDWLPPQIWNKICLCEQLEPMFEGLLKNFSKQQEHWKELFDCEQLDDNLFPPNEKSITKEWPLFMKLVIIKIFRPDKLPQALQDYVFREMGKRFLSPPIFDIEQSYNDSNYSTPLIFILPGTDPLNQLIQFAAAKKKKETMKVISLGQGQGPRVERCIAEARKLGHWVLLQNCHLYPSWMPRLDYICEQMQIKQTQFDVKLSTSFRLWLTSYPSDDFPTSILQSGIKMTNEPPLGLKSNMIGSYKTEPLNDQHFFEQSKNPAVFKKLAYGLTMFHAILQQRRNFGSLGWNIRYEFTVSDLQISMKQLQFFVDNYKEVPFKALKYLIGECNYGGRVTSLQDNRTLTALLADFMDDKVLNQGYSHLPQDKSNTYMLPSKSSPHEFYLDRINQMPVAEVPQLFGFHGNADITKNLGQSKLLLDELQSIGQVEGTDPGESDEDDGSISTKKGKRSLVRLASIGMMQTLKKAILNMSGPSKLKSTCETILNQLPKHPFDLQDIQVVFPIHRDNSMNTVLLQEVTRFNTLHGLITRTIEQILQAQRGDILMTNELSQAADQLSRGQVPAVWKRISYPSLKPLASYVLDLTLRIQMFQNWCAKVKPPEVFWLSGFYFTQSFLTAILQNFARKYRVEIDLLEFQFKFTDELDPTNWETEVFDLDKARQTGFVMSAPVDGALISGLYFEGADWDFEAKCICEQSPKQLFCKAPIIWLLPKQVEIDDPTSLHTTEFRSKISPLSQNPSRAIKLNEQESETIPATRTVDMRTENIKSETERVEKNCDRPVSPQDILTKEDRSSYKCPLYKTLDRTGVLSTTGHSSNFIFYVETPIEPVFFERTAPGTRRASKKSVKLSRTNSIQVTEEMHNTDGQHWIKRGTALFCALNN